MSSKSKILVLSDLKKGVAATLKTAVSLSKIWEADIEFFHVKKASDIIENDNQLTAFRTINQEHHKTKKKMERLTHTIFEDYGVPVSYTFAFGNIKNEIAERIQELQPDMLILNMRKRNSLKLFGDNLTSFILQRYQGPVLLVSKKNTLEPNDILSLGVLKIDNEPLNLDFINSLIKHTHKPIKVFKIVKNTSSSYRNIDDSSDQNTIEYVFEENENAIKNISNYLSKNDINLLFLDRGFDIVNFSSKALNSRLEEVITNLNVSLLLN